MRNKEQVMRTRRDTETTSNAHNKGHRDTDRKTMCDNYTRTDASAPGECMRARRKDIDKEGHSHCTPKDSALNFVERFWLIYIAFAMNDKLFYQLAFHVTLSSPAM